MFNSQEANNLSEASEAQGYSWSLEWLGNNNIVVSRVLCEQVVFALVSFCLFIGNWEQKCNGQEARTVGLGGNPAAMHLFFPHLASRLPT